MQATPVNTLFKALIFLGSEMEINKELVERIADVAGRKFIKYYTLWMLVRIGLGLLILGIFAAVSWIGLQWVLNNAPIPRLP